jgi:hypothetical protein
MVAGWRVRSFASLDWGAKDDRYRKQRVIHRLPNGSSATPAGKQKRPQTIAVKIVVW